MEVPPLLPATELARALYAGADVGEIDRLARRLWPDMDEPGAAAVPERREIARAVSGLLEQVHQLQSRTPEMLPARGVDDLLTTTTELLGVTTGGLLRLDATGQTLALVATVGAMPRLEGLNRPDHTLVRLAAAARGAFLPWPQLAAPGVPPRAAGRGAQWAAVPLRAGQATLGLLVVGAEGQSFTHGELSLIQLVGDLLAAELLRYEWVAAEHATGANGHALSAPISEANAAERSEIQRLLGLAHDFGNLLTVILGFSSLCEAHCPPEPSPLRGWLRQVGQASRRAQDLARQILGRGEPGPQTEPTSVARVLAQCACFFKALAGAGHRLEVGDTDPSLSVGMDAGALERAILNLLINARNATPAGGRLRLHAVADRANRRFGPCARITVSDDGPGLPAERLHQLAQPAQAACAHGGLGLVQVKTLVRSHGGDLSVETAPGRGTSIQILLPLARAGGSRSVDANLPGGPWRNEAAP